MSNKLKGKVALVTGGASGLGAEMCFRFAEEGVKGLIISDLEEKSIIKIKDELKSKFEIEILSMKMDVSKEEDWVNSVDLIIKKFGKLDILVNNAGVSHRIGFLECTFEDWNNTLAINQTGVFLGIKYCAPLMKDNKGSIINLSSIAGLTGYFAAAYTATKWAVRGMTKSAAMELGEWGIRVNSIHPGFIWSPLTLEVEQMVNKFTEMTALNRTGDAKEVASGVVFLASDESSFITGSELTIDGGLTAGGGVRRVAKELNLI